MLRDFVLRVRALLFRRRADTDLEDELDFHGIWQTTVVAPISSRTLHVANGTCTTDLLASAGIPGRTSIWADPLYEGPVPAGLSDDELLLVRADYLGGTVDGVPPPPRREEIAEDLRSWRAVIDDVASYDELVLWFEHDLFDQLNLIQLLTHISRAGGPARAVSLICIGSFPGRPNFKGLGELTPAEIGSLVDTRQLVSDAQFTDGSFWQVAIDLERASLVTHDIRSEASAPFPRGTIAATPRGREVLSGREDRIARSGIDRWLGGVHLLGTDQVFRWDDRANGVVF